MQTRPRPVRYRKKNRKGKVSKPGEPGSYGPVEGSHFAYLSADAGPHSPALSQLITAAAGDVLRFSVSTYRGRERLDIREYWLDEAAGEWRPTRKGISLPRDYLRELLEGVEALRAALESPA